MDNTVMIFLKNVHECTVADTYLVLFFSESSKALRIQGAANIYNGLWIFATRLKHLKRVLNISDAFETLATFYFLFFYFFNC